jgi:hypothetical protein
MKPSKWQRWFRALRPGDRVRMLFPWEDAKRPGGALRTATVIRVWPHCVVFGYRNRFGTRLTAGLRYWTGDCYHHVFPIGYELHYGPKRGYWLRRAS